MTHTSSFSNREKLQLSDFSNKELLAVLIPENLGIVIPVLRGGTGLGTVNAL